jgi:Tfp pilus assembly protein PilO
MEDILAVLLIFGGGTLVALAMSPIGRAVAARIQGHGPGGDSEELRSIRESHEAMATELEAVRQDLVELQERVDFAERVLARKRDEPSLPASQ